MSRWAGKISGSSPAGWTGPDGKSDRIVHEGVKTADRSVSIPPTAVLPGGTLLDLIEPIEHIHSRAGDGTYDDPLIDHTSGTSEGHVRSQMVHGTIKVFLPIDTNGRIREYLFQFSIRGSVFLSGWSS